MKLWLNQTFIIFLPLFWFYTLSFYAVNRATCGAYQSLVLKVKEIDRQKMFGWVCMLLNGFGHLLDKAYDYEKECSSSTHIASKRLAIALSFLAWGESENH